MKDMKSAIYHKNAVLNSIEAIKLENEAKRRNRHPEFTIQNIELYQEDIRVHRQWLDEHVFFTTLKNGVFTVQG